MKKGFTLIELLAVIVILAIIALIATPIVLSIISDSKESASLRSAEMYLDAVEYGIADVIMDNKTIQNGTHTVMENGNICIGTYSDKNCTGDIIEVEVKGETPKEGSTVTIEEGKIKGINLLYGDKTIIKDSKGNLVYGELGVEEEESLAPGLYKTDGTFVSWEQLTSTDYKLIQYPNAVDVPIKVSILNIGENGDLYSSYDDSCVTYNTDYNHSSDYLNGNLIISNVVKEISDYGFALCSNLSSVEIPNGVTTINYSAFYNCTNLTSITIPNSVVKIGLESFFNCINLKTIDFSGTKEEWSTIEFGEFWNVNCPEITVHCTDGDIVIPANN